jgi:small GTP-binding protein
MEWTLVTFSKKICLLGEFAVGKTSLVRRFVYNLFDDRYISTIGVRVSRKTVAVPVEKQVVELTMMVWDLAGSEEFNQVSMSYLRGAAGAILVYDVTRPNTFDQLYTYVLNLYKVNPQAKLVVAGNKVDLVDRHQLDTTKAQKFAAEVNAPLYFTSAKQGDDVDNLFRQLGRMLVS